MKLLEITHFDKGHSTPRTPEHFLLACRAQVHADTHFTRHRGVRLRGALQNYPAG